MSTIDFLFLEQDASNYEEAIRLCSGSLEHHGYVKDTFAQACLTRESRFPTGVPVQGGVAIPHADNIHVLHSCLCLLRLVKPVKFHRIDDPVMTLDVNFVVCIAIDKSGSHSTVLAQLVTAFQDANFIQALSQNTAEKAFAIFKERLAVTPQ